jgi:NTP pyrophosphatase (non-canonical NTP hydrolase)
MKDTLTKCLLKDDWQQLADDISTWSDATFGCGQRNPAIAYHLKKEVDELIEALENVSSVEELGMEFADCLMLLLDSASHAGISVDELMIYARKKLEINKTRIWGKPDENGVIEHV